MIFQDHFYLFFTFFHVLLFIGKSTACMCEARPDSTSICSADFGLKAKVVSSGEVVGTNRVYEILPLVVYHLPDFPFETKQQKQQNMKKKWGDCGRKKMIHLFDIDFFRLYTAVSEAECGLTLNKGREYMFTGKFDASFPDPPKRLRVGVCDWVQDWDNISDQDIVFISYPDKCYRP